MGLLNYLMSILISLGVGLAGFSVAWVAVSDAGTTFLLHLDNDGDGIPDQFFGPLVAVLPDVVPRQAELKLLPDVVPRQAELKLLPARPNPVTREAILGFQLPAQGTLDLTVFDAACRRVAGLARGPHAAGPHTVVLTSREGYGGRRGPWAMFCAPHQCVGEQDRTAGPPLIGPHGALPG